MTLNNPIRILYIEDDQGLAQLLKKRFERLGITVDLAASGEEGLRIFDPTCHQVIAVDQNMPGMGGLDVIKVLATYNPVPPMIMITGSGDERVAVEAMKLGAHDYIVKDVEGGYLELLPSVIGRALYQQQLIDEKRQAEETLRESEERYRSLVELSPDGIVVCHETTLVYVNNAAVRLLHARNAPELRTAAITTLIHPDSLEMVWAKLQRTQTYGEQVVFLEGKLLCLDGQSIDVEMMAAPIMFENKAATQIILRDITERKRAQQAQHESERLRLALDKEKELGDLKTRFMITISHEFRTPLSVAYASAELLERYFDRMELEQREEHLHRVEIQIRKLTEMLEDISLIIHARFEPLALNIETVNLRKLCESAIAQIQDFDEDHERIVFTLEDRLPNLMLDVRRIKYVLSNLLTNALKYSGKDKPVRLDVFRHEEGIMLQVTDQGIGIPPEEQSRIFDPFFRARNVGSIRGTGLGLSIVKEIVEMHNGVITVNSVVNQGTEITVFLPQK